MLDIRVCGGRNLIFSVENNQIISYTIRTKSITYYILYINNA